MKQIVEKKLNEVRARLRAMPKAFTPPKNTADRQKLLVAITQQYLRYLTDCIRGEYWDRVLVRHPELRMYNTVLKKFEFFQAQVGAFCDGFMVHQDKLLHLGSHACIYDAAVSI